MMRATSGRLLTNHFANRTMLRRIKPSVLLLSVLVVLICWTVLFNLGLSWRITGVVDWNGLWSSSLSLLLGKRHDLIIYPSNPDWPSFAFARFTKHGQGFFNQQMAFSGAMMMLVDHMSRQSDVHYQVVLPSLVFLDYLGTDRLVEFDRLFDVEHWNSFAPRLPRIVSYDKQQHWQYSVQKRAMKRANPPGHPFFVQVAANAFVIYHRGYMTKLEMGNRTQLDPTDRLILQSALRPAPAVQAIVEKHTRPNETNHNYAAMHLRFEQDYLCHGWKVHDRNLAVVLHRVETKLGPNPPFDRIFLAINRRLLEDPTKMPPNPYPSAEVCESERQENLATLNRIVQQGMWGGRVQVFERAPLPRDFADRPVIFGSLIDSEICIHAKVFLGRFSSTYTKNIMRRRLMKGLYENYNYEGGFYKMGGDIWPTVVEDYSQESSSPIVSSSNNPPTDDNKPLISFIIPSTLTRPTLNQTIESLQRQSITNWEAIVGVDVRISPLRSVDEAIAAATKYYNDSRIKIVPIRTESDDRGQGPTRNGAGGVRNLIMQFYAKADWVAFCDDDDTLTPYYIEYWQQGLQQLSSHESSPDILIFRMQDHRIADQWYQGILPPKAHGPVASLISVGISFAVRRSIVSPKISQKANTSVLQFEPGQAEDFYFLLKAQTRGHKIGLACCVAYYVRSTPPANESRQDICIWEKSYILEVGLRHVQHLGPPIFNDTKVVPCPALPW